MRRRRGIMELNGGAGITATATGNPLTFETDLAKPLKSLVIPFTPIQADGTPSPDNPLPISGWTVANISGTGKNLFDKSKVIRGKYIGASGTPSSSSAFGYALCHVAGLSRVRISGNKAENSAARYVPFDFNGNPILSPSPQGKGNKTITLPTGAYTLAVNVYISGTNMDIDTVQVESGNVASAYEPFGKTITVNWQTEAGTVYGGSLTLNEDGSADLVADTTIVDLGDYPFSQYGSSNHCWTGQIPPMSYVINNNPVVCCEEYKVLGPQSILSNGQNLAIWAYSSTKNARVVIRNDSFIGESGAYDIAALNNSLSGVHICCLMKTPITYHFDNVGQLITFVGTNNIWTDTNSTNTATYLKHQS